MSESVEASVSPSKFNQIVKNTEDCSFIWTAPATPYIFQSSATTSDTLFDIIYLK